MANNLPTQCQSILLERKTDKAGEFLDTSVTYQPWLRLRLAFYSGDIETTKFSSGDDFENQSECLKKMVSAHDSQQR